MYAIRSYYAKVAASGPKGRIVKEDLTKYVKGVMSGATAAPVAAAGARNNFV